MRSPEVSEFATRDPELAHAQISDAYTDHRFTILGHADDFAYRHHRVDAGGVRIDAFHNSPTVEYDVAGIGYPLIIRVLSGTMTSLTDGVQREVGPGAVFLVTRPSRRYLSRMHGTSVEAVGIDQRLFARVEPRAVERLRHLSVRPLDSAGARAWQQTVDYVNRMASDEFAGSSPLLLGQAGRLLAATVLALFDPDPAADRAVDHTDATPDTVRRAVDFIHDHLAADIGVSDIAAASDVTVRALQLAFRRHLATTPMAYVRRRRLDRVQQDLRAADPASGITVGAIAARWGFGAAGRFSAHYRAAFGEAPYDTFREV